MRKIPGVILFLFLAMGLMGQSPGGTIEGSISYITSQNVYVKFQSTDNMQVGDTLFIKEADKLKPALLVKELSSISCVCTPISKKQFSVSEKITARVKETPLPKIVDNVVSPSLKPEPVVTDTSSVKKILPVELKENISGRIAVSSYSNFSNVADFSQRMRYTFSLNAQNINDSKVSAETYISFVHKMNEWSEVKNDIFNGLKIYSLSVNYAFNKNNVIWVGRKINPRLSNMGAVDGLQFETKLKSLRIGVVAGTRPDYTNYSFNAKLLQYGGYLSHDITTKKGSMQSSVAFVEQKNNGFTDRRFAYFQHSNSLLTNLYFFGSVEFDLYNKVLNVQDSTYSQNNSPNLSNFYVSIRYKVTKQLSLSVSYSERQNIIYYETYKSIVDQLLEDATMKGLMFQINYRPFKNISFGANAGYRYSKEDRKASKNVYTYITYTNVPWLKASATLSATLMQTGYLNGNIYSLGLTRDLVPGKLSGGVSYRYVNYKFESLETPLVQHMGEMNLNWRLMKKLSCSINYEGTFEKGRNYDRIYVNLTKRF